MGAVVLSHLRLTMLSHRLNMAIFIVILGMVILPQSLEASYATEQVPKCHTEYDIQTTYEERCSTSHEQECNTVHEEVCMPRLEKVCDTIEAQVCCINYERECSKNNERQCVVLNEQECSTEYD